jgi:hypothetical protein
MPRGDHISLMADEVQKDISERIVSFNRAFSWAAHRRGITHAKNRETYNTWFGQVRARISKRDNAGLKKALQGERPWQHGKIVQTGCRRRKWRPDDPWCHEDPDNFVFPENEQIQMRIKQALPLIDD